MTFQNNNIVSHSKISLPVLSQDGLSSISNLTELLGVPRKVLASDDEILHAWKDLPRELNKIPAVERNELVARMCIAIQSGLFDGAINYIWNASILHLRNKIIKFGLPIISKITKKDMEEKNLFQLTDIELIKLCLQFNIIDQTGSFMLNQCREIRNKFSAAHPNLGQIDDRELISFINRCTKFALTKTHTIQGVDISEFTSAIKNNTLTDEECSIWIGKLKGTNQDQLQMFITMLHGIYCDPSSPEIHRLNALKICQDLKCVFSSTIHSDLINQHHNYFVKGETNKHNASRIFFEEIKLIRLLSEPEKNVIFSKAIDNLYNAYMGMNNFYTEPPFAERLLDLSTNGETPESVQENFVIITLMCYVGRSYGYSWESASKCSEIIKNYSPKEISIMIDLLYKKENELIKSQLSYPECRTRFKTILIDLVQIHSIPSTFRNKYDTIIKSLA